MSYRSEKRHFWRGTTELMNALVVFYLALELLPNNGACLSESIPAGSALSVRAYLFHYHRSSTRHQHLDGTYLVYFTDASVKRSLRLLIVLILTLSEPSLGAIESLCTVPSCCSTLITISEAMLFHILTDLLDVSLQSCLCRKTSVLVPMSCSPMLLCALEVNLLCL